MIYTVAVQILTYTYNSTLYQAPQSFFFPFFPLLPKSPLLENNTPCTIHVSLCVLPPYSHLSSPTKK